MSNDQNKINKKTHEKEVISVQRPLKPWAGSIRNYKPSLSKEFKKRQKLQSRDKVLLIVQKQINENSSDTIEFCLELSEKKEEPASDLNKSIQKQKALKKSLQEILAKEKKQNKNREEFFQQKEEKWRIDKDLLEKEKGQLKRDVGALKFEIETTEKQSKTITNDYKSEIETKQNEYDDEKKKNFCLEQQLENEKNRRKSLHNILNENAKESRKDFEKLTEVQQERDDALKERSIIAGEKAFWREKESILNKNAREKNKEHEKFLNDQKFLEKTLYSHKEKVDLLEKENQLLKNKIQKYMELGNAEFLVGEEIFGSRGIYQITQQYKKGGMGSLYLAKRLKDDEIVVIKTLQCSSSEEHKLVLRFIQEARMMLHFQHPNLVKGLDFCQTPDNVFLVMEYIKGNSLEEVANEKIIEEKTAANIILQVARALNYLNTLGIVHRDVKPSNIMVTENKMTKLMDFGILKSIHDKCALTTSGIIMGTPYYLSPEQVTSGHIDIKSDIYSLGITFFQLVTGKMPFQGENQVEVIAKRLTKASPRVRKENPQVNKKICHLIEKMMERKPSKRPTPFNIIEELESFLDCC